MPKKRNAHRQEEILSRMVVISAVEESTCLHADAPRGSAPFIDSSAWLEVNGRVDEPVGDVSDISITLHPDDKTVPGPARPACVGAIIRAKPHLDAVVGIPHVDLDRLWSLALAGQLKYGHLAFTKPRRNMALIVSVSFSSQPEE